MIFDLNGFFAAVEQQDRPELRGRPVAVVPVLSDTSFVIASSVEAKRLGIKCGVRIGDAREICPGLVVLQARPSVYTTYFARIREVVETVLPIAATPSIDELHLRLLGGEMAAAKAREIALEIKRRLRTEIGPVLTASAGIAPNRFLAKVATDMEKPNGLVVLPSRDLPECLNVIENLDDLCGINRRMKLRLNASGIFTVADLVSASPADLRRVWGGVVGERWWYLLRGYDLAEAETKSRTLGHSHVLPPELRHRAGVRAVALRLLGKACARLRLRDQWANGLSATVKGQTRWESSRRIPATQDDRDLVPILAAWLDAADVPAPTAVAVGLWDLCGGDRLTPSLFDEAPPPAPSVFARSLDAVNNRWGKQSVYLGAMHAARGTADEKIAFGKTSLFSEGAGDHEEGALRERLNLAPVGFPTDADGDRPFEDGSFFDLQTPPW